MFLGLVKFNGVRYSINGVDKESELTVKAWSNSRVITNRAKACEIIAAWVAAGGKEDKKTRADLYSY